MKKDLLGDAPERAADTLARTIYGEARGEPWAGKLAVAHVVINRAVSDTEWWGDSVTSVCRHPFQFSCWNDGDPNRDLIETVSLSDRAYVECYAAALRALSGGTDDPTAGATHYHAHGVEPSWAAGKDPCAMIGGHLFYGNID